LLLKIVFVTVFALALGVFAVATIQIGAIHPTSLSEAEIIRARNPVRLVSPDWVSPTGDIFEWLKAETRARMALLVLLWLVGIVSVTLQHFRPPALKAE
jgi:hypothetical protein